MGINNSIWIIMFIFFVFVSPIYFLIKLVFKIREILKVQVSEASKLKILGSIIFAFLIYFVIILFISAPISLCTTNCPPQWLLTYRTWLILSLLGFNLYIPFILAHY